MIINGKSIRGIFNYSPELTFEVGDFVVDGDYMYLALQESTGNKPSESTEFFETYVGGEVLDPSQYKVGSIKKDSLLSAAGLDSILSSYFSGPDENGLIRNRITSDLRIISSGLFESGNVDSTTSPLDTIMCKPDLNNAVFHVDPNSDAKLVLPPEPNRNETEINYILKQYTYRDSDGSVTGEPGSFVRIQELVKLSKEYSATAYRFITSRTGESYEIGENTIWNQTCLQFRVLSELDRIKAYYISEINKTKKLQKLLANNFRFKKVSFNQKSNILRLTYGGPNAQLPVSPTDAFDFPTTFTFTTIDTLGYSRSYDITLELKEIVKNGIDVSYKVGDSNVMMDIKFERSIISGNTNNITFTLSGSAIFQSCYYQQVIRSIDEDVNESVAGKTFYEFNIGTMPEGFVNFNTNWPMEIAIETRIKTRSSIDRIYVDLGEIFQELKKAAGINEEYSFILNHLPVRTLVKFTYESVTNSIRLDIDSEVMPSTGIDKSDISGTLRSITNLNMLY